MKKSLIIVLLALCSTPCFAIDGIDGNELQKACESESNADDGFCVGYIIGAADAFLSVGFICSKGIQYGQIRKVVLKYLRNNPERLHYSANSLVGVALAEAFPCK